MNSLKRRLIWILLALTLVAWVTSALVTGAYATRVMLDQVDRQLLQYSDLVNYITQIFVRQVDEGLPVYEPWFRHSTAQRALYPMVIEGPVEKHLSPGMNIWLGEDLLAVMEDSPRFPRPSVEGFSFRQEPESGGRWRVLSKYDVANDLWFLVGIELEAARWEMWATLGRAMFPLIIILPLSLVFFYFGISRGLRPLKVLANQISTRKPGALEAVDTQDVPLELQPVVSAINSLLSRLANALEGEQNFTANAAHELLTPLAAIKTEVQLCQKKRVGDGDPLLFDRITARVDRASHTVEQLLTLARLDPDSTPVSSPVQLSKLLGEMLAETAHLAADRGLEVEYNYSENVIIAGDEEALAILLRNLLVNAFRYASDDSIVRVTLECEEGPRLEVCNDCEPFTDEEFEHLGRRFYRRPGSRGMGAGLGLSIVSCIVDSHNAQLSRQTKGDVGGFCVSVQFTPN
jgi:signal transduction histidine kinase